MRVFENFSSLVGNTPLLRLKNIEKEYALECNLFAKLECFNPASSVKDRAALEMINDAEKRGILKSGGTIIESTSGNTGVGLCAVGVPRGYNVILTMPDTMSIERQLLLKAYGATIVLTDGALGMQGAIDKANELKQTIKDAVILGQFENEANVNAHYKTTAVEIYNDLDGKVDVFVSGIGSGGTITGCAKYLKEQNESIKVIGIEPHNSPFLTKGQKGAHSVMGIGAGFKPEILDTSLIDEIETIKEQDAYEMGKLLAKKEGILCGITSGAALFVAVNKAKSLRDKNVVVLLPDTGERYLSTEMFK